MDIGETVPILAHEMKAHHKKNKVEAPALVVGAPAIARLISCSPRYVHMLGEAGTIPSYRFGKRCIRFNVREVLTALGIPAEAVAGAAK